MKKNRKEKEVELLKTLKRLKFEDQKNIIEYLNETAINLIGECFHNIISTDLRLKKSQRQKLKEKLPANKKIIQFIAKKSNCPEKRRKKLLQTGNLLKSNYDSIAVLCCLFTLF